MNYEELRHLVAIDDTQLDQECAIEPELFLDASELAADARAEAKAAKHNLEIIEATLQLKFRGGEIRTEVKITEMSVLALVDSHQEVLAAKNALLIAEKKAAKCEALSQAFDHKRSMLKNEVELVVSGWGHSTDIRPKAGVEDAIRKRRREGSGR